MRFLFYFLFLFLLIKIETLGLFVLVLNWVVDFFNNWPYTKFVQHTIKIKTEVDFSFPTVPLVYEVIFDSIWHKELLSSL